MSKYPGYMIFNKVLQWLWLLCGAQGVFIWSLGCIGILMDLELYGVGSLILGLVLVGLSGWMFARGLARRRLAKSYRLVSAMLSENSYVTVEEMAGVMGMRPAKLRIDLRRLLKHHLLPGYALNEATGELVLLAHASAPAAMRSTGQPMIAARCRSCGAMVDASGGRRCEYCGSLLEIE